MSKQNKKIGQVRIISGELRSRVIHFPAIQQLRPSPDAVRETLFNWLTADIPQANCLDLYSGSGIFSFEALSRGANTATLVDNHSVITGSLKSNAALLHLDEKATIICADAEQYLATTTHQYDIIFLDPPFAKANYQRLFKLITKFNVLTPDGLIYVECAKSNSMLPIMPTWHVVRQKALGMVQSTLIKNSSTKIDADNY